MSCFLMKIILTKRSSNQEHSKRLLQPMWIKIQGNHVNRAKGVYIHGRLNSIADIIRPFRR